MKRLTHLTRHAMFIAGRLGLFGWLGCLLLAGAGFYFLFIAPARQAAVEVAREDIERAQLRRQNIEARLVREAPTEAPVVVVPPQAMTPALVGMLQDIARDGNVDIKRNDYRYVEPAPLPTQKRGKGADGRDTAAPPAHADNIIEVRIVVPARGRYRDLRAFLSNALEELPTLALDGLTLRRDSIAAGEAEAQLHFTLFVKGRP